MDLNKVTLQTHLDGRWQDAMVIRFDQPEQGLASVCSAEYVSRYLVEHLHALDSVLQPSVSAGYPLSWDIYRGIAPAFLHDIIPAGAARRHILARMSVPLGTGEDFFLLQQCTTAPIGHLRILEGVEGLPSSPLIGFSRSDVIRRDVRFLDHAYEHGAAVGGASGAGGEAPKLLLAEDVNGALYPDASLPDDQVRRHWFVKFPRHPAQATDRNILFSEYCYYRALGALGFSTIASEGLAYEEGKLPSLWMPRFDRQVADGVVKRIAVESIYSLCGVTRPGSRMSHVAVAERLAEVWTATGQQQEIPDMLREYLRRDLINQLLGNTDNHGRNLSVLRGKDHICLAPMYDIAPMVMDPAGVVRTTRWPDGIEQLNQVDWRRACQQLAHWADADELFEGLRADAAALLALPDLLSTLQLPEETWNAPLIPLRRLPATLQKWGLI
ncbi:hypothetical protein BN1049_01265 [Pseudomonas saudimassiliensis]|uniref:HipA-like C-terminal domain-containing protein n=1 Tax=Pseudomonas saudimassiliensis TaxID=1461581 RepID=A0A078MEJ8_9PSED|nr:hypothetical protein BN1049_01265 [Pseudomonas saudimassiliensis]CEF26336.1 hypothetical protein BN1049_01265 [Pseudomonas saudimassiliensis]